MKTIKISKLSVKSVNRAIGSVASYQRSLQRKAKEFCSRLADCGISVARMNSGIYGSYISFTKELPNARKYNAKAILLATNRGVVKSRWLTYGGVVEEADINPILMAEFGSGWHSDDLRGKPFGAGQGTHPRQVHAFEPEWKYMDLQGDWHTVDGEEPTAPLDNAMREMYVQIARVGMEVFGNG